MSAAKPFPASLYVRLIEVLEVDAATTFMELVCPPPGPEVPGFSCQIDGLSRELSRIIADKVIELRKEITELRQSFDAFRAEVATPGSGPADTGETEAEAEPEQ